MAKILPLPAKPPSKLGFERVRTTKRQQKDPEKHGQMNMFVSKSGKQAARIVNMPTGLSPFEEALLLDERGEEKAADLYLQAIEQGDSIADAYCNLGILESKSGKTEKAFDCFTKSLKEDPRHLESHYNLANLYFDMENLRLAEQHYEIAAQIDHKFPNVYFNMGLVLALSENLQEAIKVLEAYKNLVSEEEGNKADELLKSLRRSLAAKR